MKAVLTQPTTLHDICDIIYNKNHPVSLFNLGTTMEKAQT